jgi:hypothetical protein
MESMRLLVLCIVIAATLGGGLAQEAPAPAPASPVTTAEPIVVPALDLQPDASGAVPQEQIRELLRRVAEKDLENEKRLRDYTYIQREEEHKLGGHGEIKKIESRTSEVLVVYGEQIERLIAKDDKPLSAASGSKKKRKIAKTAASLCSKLPTPTTST